MAKKPTLNDLTSLTNETSVVSTINNNNDEIETSFENTISRDGSTPNQMNANLDMNNNRILNHPDPVADSDVATFGIVKSSVTDAETAATEAAASAALAATFTASVDEIEENRALAEAAAVGAASSEIAAETAAAQAASSASEGLYSDVVTKTFSDSPLVPLLSEDGTMFTIDTSGGDVVVNLKALSVYGSDMKFAFAKTTADVNSIIINRGGTDEINGETSLTIVTQYESHVLIGDSGAGTWLDSVQATGITDGSVSLVKMADLAQDQFIGRVTTSTGVPETATITAAARTLLDDATVGAIRTTLGLVISTDVQPFDADTAKTDVAQEYTKTQNFNATTLSDGANISWDASANQVTSVTLGGNRTLDNPTNLVDGATYIIIVTQDGTGSRTLAYGNAFKFSEGVTPTLSTGASDIDILTFVSDGTSMYGVIQKNFS